MKTFKHQKFLTENNIDTNILPAMLQKRINLFSDMVKKHEDMTEKDQTELMKKLKVFDIEIEEDLEQHFEDQLENNDEEDLPEPEPEIEPTDEEILDTLKSDGVKSVSKADLQAKGFKGNLNSRKIVCGKRSLYKPQFKDRWLVC